MIREEGVRLIINENYPLDERTAQALAFMSEAEGVVKPIVALPDVHYKFSYHTPTGVVALTKKSIIPKFVNANCGMSFISTGITEDELEEETIDGIFHYLRDNIAVTTRKAPIIPLSEAKKIIKTGAEWVFKENGNLDPDDLLNFENQGSLFKNDPRPLDDILSCIPGYCLNIAPFSLGVLGYGNHFIELQVVDEIINAELAVKLGVFPKQVCLMVHSDSRAFGQSIFDFYSEKSKKIFGLQQVYKELHYRLFSSPLFPRVTRRFLETINKSLNRAKSVVYWKMEKQLDRASPNFEVIPAESEEGIAYLTATYCAINFGYANRAYLASLAEKALALALGHKATKLRILLDVNHDCLQKEMIEGSEFYVHRNGAVKALPPRYFPGHPIFSQTGQPVILPSCLGMPSFLCAAAKGCPESYFSSSHGTGRLIDRGEARKTFDSQNLFTELKSRKMKIYDYGKGYSSEEAPGAFKDVNRILETIIKHDIAKPVARLKPLAALKGWR